MALFPTQSQSEAGAGSSVDSCRPDPAIYDAMANDVPEATDARRHPFGSRRDARLYLFQVVAVVTCVAGGSALFISGRVPLGFGVFGMGVVIFLLFLRPRSARLEPPSEWPVRVWNESQREMDTLRLRHMRAALRVQGLPEALSYIVVGVAALVVATAVVVNWDAYF